jgi:hypothetical protein
VAKAAESGAPIVYARGENNKQAFAVFPSSSGKVLTCRLLTGMVGRQILL